MSLSRNEDDVIRLGQLTGSLDSLPPVGDGHDLFEVMRLYPRFHFLDDLLRIFRPGIITGENNFGTQGRSYLAHLRSLCLIAIASTAYHRDQFFILGPDAVDGLQHILQSIGSMSIIYDGGDLGF